MHGDLNCFYCCRIVVDVVIFLERRIGMSVEEIIIIRNIYLQKRLHTIINKVANESQKLNHNEYMILLNLIENAPNPLTLDELGNFCWGSNHSFDSDSLKPHISRLKKKMCKILDGLQLCIHQDHGFRQYSFDSSNLDSCVNGIQKNISNSNQEVNASARTLTDNEKDEHNKEIKQITKDVVAQSLKSAPYIGINSFLNKRLDELISQLNELLEEFIYKDDVFEIRNTMRKIKNLIVRYFDFVRHILKIVYKDDSNGSGTELLQWIHSKVDEHRVWLVDYITKYATQISQMDDNQTVKYMFLYEVCDFHITIQSCQTEMMLFDEAIRHDTNLHNKQRHREELENNLKDAYKDLTVVEAEVDKELDNLSKTHSSDIGTK